MTEIAHHCPNTPVVLVATKTDLRHDTATINRLAERGQSILTTEQIEAAARELGVPFVETSARHMTGLTKWIEMGIDAAVSPTSIFSKSKKSSKFRLFGSSKSSEPKKELRAPELPPPKNHAPNIQIDTSTYADGLASLVMNEQFSDMDLVHEEIIIPGHRIVLAASSPLFEKILVDDQHDQSVNYGEFVQFTKIERDGRVRVTINHEMIDKECFDRVIDFLYTGCPNIEPNAKLEKLEEAAVLFNLTELSSYIENIKQKDPELNPSISTYLNDELAKKIMEKFFNKELFSDVTFSIEEKTFFGHKAMLCCNSPVMATMMNSKFIESSSNVVEIADYDYASYVAFLEYLYTAHVPLTDETAVPILTICNQYSLPRPITLCELYISKIIEKATTEGIEKAEIDIISLLLVSQDHNALKLAEFCKHFICTNFQPMKKRPEFESLGEENLKYVTENQWPPLSYWNELAEYEKAIGISGVGTETVNNNKKCCIM
jgi:GTPase SAR1 family protein